MVSVVHKVLVCTSHIRSLLQQGCPPVTASRYGSIEGINNAANCVVTCVLFGKIPPQSPVTRHILSEVSEVNCPWS